MKAIEKAKAWAQNNYFSEESRKEIQQLLDKNDTEELIDRFYKSMEFGTGGIRGVIGAGENRMNYYNVRKATQALATVLNKTFDKSKVAIGYDSRNFSLEFAKETASVLAANDIEVFIYDKINPVALLSYSVRHHKAQAGVVITASHNPPEYNGYKVYWDDGAQVIPPHDQNIINAYNEISDYSTIKIMNFEIAEQKGLVHWVGEEVENEYYKRIKTKTIRPELCKKRGTELCLVYTPIHGTGLIPCTTALKNIGLTNFHLVEEQTSPDGNFPTVKSPNPENPEALKMAVDLMREKGADIAFGTDPDDDRIGLAIPQKDKIVYLSGNQIGTLMLHYIITGLKEQNRMPEHPYFVKTIVTTRLQDKIANHFGVRVENTLTGFKWICGKVREIEQNDSKWEFLFGTEESFGYLNHDWVRDKDGCAPIALLAEMALYYKTKGMDMASALDKIYEEFGFHHEDLLNLHYFGKEGSEKIQRIMHMFREKRPERFAGDKITAVEDYQSGLLTSVQTGKTETMNVPRSNVLGFHFESGNLLYCRPSGTEPKIKFYTMIKETEGLLDDMKRKAHEKSHALIDFIKAEADKA